MWTNTLPVLTFAVGSVDGDKVRGVNLGGWFILENWMMPSFFEDSVVRDTYINDEVSIAPSKSLWLS